MTKMTCLNFWELDLILTAARMDPLPYYLPALMSKANTYLYHRGLVIQARGYGTTSVHYRREKIIKSNEIDVVVKLVKAYFDAYLIDPNAAKMSNMYAESPNFEGALQALKYKQQWVKNNLKNV